ASDIESVTRAVNDLQLATIDYSVLSDPSGGVAMLASMVDAELRDADTVIVLGPEGRVRVPLPASLPERPFTARLFYFDYQRRTGFASSPLPPISPNGRGPRGRGGPGGPGRGGGPGGRGPGPGGAPPSDTIRQLVKRRKGIVLDVRAPADFARAVRRV